jgi:hypothetical protein
MGALAGPAVAASPEIEGVWSFSGGQVAIHGLPGGASFEGVVVTPTKFAQCTHQAGETMWTAITAQPDGSYWGLHQWLFESPECVANPTLGPTAWRVLPGPSGRHFLRVCFSEPGKSQPAIAPDGTSTNVSYGCQDSELTAPLPGSGNSGGEQISFSKAVGLPKGCVARHSLKLKLRDPKYDPLKEVVVRVRGRKIADVRGVKGLRKGVVLKGLPNGNYTIEVVATTVLDQKLSGRRAYHSCGKNSTGSLPLHGHKSRRRR